MICVQCNVENPDSGKFCRSCGATLGILCTRCGVVARPDDRYCTSCGFSLAGQSGEGSPTFSSRPGSGDRAPSVKQYTPLEIEELLALRKTVKREEAGAKTLSQADVDDLFG